MYYYEVLVGSNKYHGEEALTYRSKESLSIGNIVVVSLRNSKVMAIVVKKVNQPSFTTKPIVNVLPISLPNPSLELLNWLRQYYPAPLGLIVNQFAPTFIAPTLSLSKQQHQLKKHTLELPPLTLDQRKVIEIIRSKPTGPYWLHGVTGSGKTRVYIELAKEKLKEGKQVLILTPEIGLTSQLAKAFSSTVGASVIVLHSNLTPAERHRAWQLLSVKQEPCVIIGPRSAIFAPFAKLGLIVADEAHETAYKQEQAPRYYALRVTGQLAKIHGALLIFGSATPPVTEYYIAKQKNIPILEMETPAIKSNTHLDVKVINLREREHFTKDPNLSNSLLESIQKSLANKEQSLVFLNRRGTAKVILCQICGWQARCPRCDLPVTYHGDNHTVRCHTCGYHDTAPGQCQVCSSTDIVFRSIGTKALVNSLERHFPSSKIRRFDTDNLKSERLESNFSDLAAGKIDILVGTQLLAKGLDLPGLSTVGVVVADSGLSLPDYTSEERTYQLLHQVLGRVGRGHRDSRAVIQTYNPDSPAISAAVRHDWKQFYETQLEERHRFGFPPFCYLLKLSCARKSRDSAQKAASLLCDSLGRIPRIQVIGPVPAFYERQGGKYHWQVVVKATVRQNLIDIVSKLPANWTHDLDPMGLL